MNYTMPVELQNKIDALKSEMKSTQGRAQAILAKADREHRDLTAGETSDCDRLHRRFDQIETEIADETEAWGSQVLPRVVPPQPLAGQRAYSGSGGSPRIAVPGAARFADLFGNSARGQSPFANLGQFATAVATNDPRLHQIYNSSGMSEGVGADGGFAVPAEIFYPLIDGALGDEIVRRFATIIPMSSAAIDIPLFDSTDHTKGVGGLLGKTTAEGVAAATQKPTMATMTLKATKFVVLVPSTLELMTDAPQIFGGLLQQHMGKALAASLDDAFINGTGAGQPLGLLNSPCKITVAKETSPAQVAATVVAQNIAKMAGRMLPGSWSRAVWIAAPSVLPQLYQMQSKVLNQAQSDYVGGASTGWFSVDASGGMTLMGRPLLISDKCQQVGTEGDLYFADLSTFYIGLRQDASLAVDFSKGFAESECWYRLSLRCDAQSSYKSAVTPRKGTDTLSPIITLAVRS